MLCPDRVLQVDEIYSVPDVGTVVGGTLYRRVLESSGCVKKPIPHRMKNNEESGDEANILTRKTYGVYKYLQKQTTLNYNIEIAVAQ